MYYSHTSDQQGLFKFDSMGFDFSNNDLVDIAETAPWDRLMALFEPLYSDTGRNSKSIRMMIGLEIAKTVCQQSDERIVARLKTDTAVMILCGFDAAFRVKAPDPSSMTNFRKRWTEPVKREFTYILAGLAVEKLPAKKRGQVASDTTCIPADITYPTDKKLIIRAVDKLFGMVEEARAKGGEIALTGRRKAEGLILSGRKMKSSTGKKVNEIKKGLIEFGEEVLEKVEEVKGDISKRGQEEIKTIKKVFEQQREMIEKGTNRVKDRIVSIHEEKIRPIVRGKAGKRTEFGKKISIMTVGQKVIIPNVSRYDNFHDGSIVDSDIERYEEITGRKPREYVADKGYHTKDNHRKLSEQGIKDGIHYRGRMPESVKKESKATRERMYRQRSPVEGKIGLLKRRYGCNRIKYKSENADMAVLMAAAVNNLKVCVEYG